MKVLILSGISGSGKTEIANSIKNAIICSADAYFMIGGKYHFDAEKIHEAHNACLAKFTEELMHWTGKRKNSLRAKYHGTPIIVVDNTNTTIEEIAPYYSLARAFGADVEIHTCYCNDLYSAFKRNKHGVSYAVIEKQYNNLCNRRFPDYWNFVHTISSS